jgi:hypothetical protein
MVPRLSCGAICSVPSLISVFVLCCQPSCHNCVHLAIVFKFVILKILLKPQKHENCLTRIPLKGAVSVCSLFMELYPCKPVLWLTLVTSRLREMLYLFICFYEVSRLNYFFYSRELWSVSRAKNKYEDDRRQSVGENMAT